MAHHIGAHCPDAKRDVRNLHADFDSVERVANSGANSASHAASKEIFEEANTFSHFFDLNYDVYLIGTLR